MCNVDLEGEHEIEIYTPGTFYSPPYHSKLIFSHCSLITHAIEKLNYEVNNELTGRMFHHFVEVFRRVYRFDRDRARYKFGSKKLFYIVDAR